MPSTKPRATRLPQGILAQPDDTTCGPTCLHAVYQYWADTISLADVIAQTHVLPQGGTLAVHLACHALERGYDATIWTYNLHVFDPTWFQPPKPDLAERLQAQLEVKGGDQLCATTQGYLRFLPLGGRLRFQPPRETLINSPALWRTGGVRIKARFRRRSGATSRKRNAEASAACAPRRAGGCVASPSSRDCLQPTSTVRQGNSAPMTAMTICVASRPGISWSCPAMKRKGAEWNCRIPCNAIPWQKVSATRWTSRA